MTVTEECDNASEDALDYLASLFQNADYKQIMKVNFEFQTLDLYTNRLVLSRTQ